MMDFAHERYVRLYVRNSASWRLLGWEGRAVWVALYREADPMGVINLHGRPPVAIAMLHGELPQAVATAGMARCLEQQWFVHDGDRLTIPRYVEANETPTSSTQRVRQYRARKLLERSVPRGNDPLRNETSETDETFHVTRRVSSGAARIGHEWMLNATGRHYGLEWRTELEFIGSKPAAERAIALKAVQADPWCKSNVRVDPRHAAKHWARYAAGNPAPPASNGTGRYAGPSRVATQAEYEADKTEKAPWET